MEVCLESPCRCAVFSASINVTLSKLPTVTTLRSHSGNRSLLLLFFFFESKHHHGSPEVRACTRQQNEQAKFKKRWRSCPKQNQKYIFYFKKIREKRGTVLYTTSTRVVCGARERREIRRSPAGCMHTHLHICLNEVGTLKFSPGI